MAGMVGLAHVGLFINDLERSVDFYRDILGFEVAWRCEIDEPGEKKTKVCFVRLGNLTLELVERPEKEDRQDGWVDHVAIAVEDIELVAAQLREKGLAFETQDPVFNERVFAQGSKWFMFRGPDGEHLEISEVL